MRGEELLEVIEQAQERLSSGELTVDSPEYPLNRLELMTTGEQVTGLAAGAPLSIRHCVALRVEYKPT